MAAALPLPPPLPGQPLATVLMAVRVSVSGPRSLGLAVPGGEAEGSGGAGSEGFRLVLSMEPERVGEFRLALRNGSASSGSSMNIMEYNLRDISYEVRGPKCHELTVISCPEHRISFTIEDEREAQKWWTVISSSLREVQKASISSSAAPLPPAVKDNMLKPAPDAVKTTPVAAMSQMQKPEDLLLRLARAIESGDQLTASRCAMSLAQQQMSLRIQLKESNYTDTGISMKVGVEDATSSAVITVKTFPYTTIETLKQQVFQDYGFHPSVQQWIIGQCLCVDERTVSSYGIKKDGDMAFLYLLSAKQANLSKLRYEEEQALAMMLPAAVSARRNSLVAEEKQKFSTMPTRLSPKRTSRTKERDGKMDIDDITRFLNLDILQLSDHPAVNGPKRLVQPQQTPAPAASPKSGWECPTCTYINKPTRPGCEMCSTARPANYVVPGEYRPDETERWRLQQEQDAMLQYQQEKGRREDGSLPFDLNLNSQDDFVHFSEELY